MKGDLFPLFTHGRSSAGRVVVSKTIGRGFEPYRPCKLILSKVSKFKTYIDETVNEMVHNVSWPTWKELQNNTIIVVIATLIFAVLIFAMDFVFGISGEEKSAWKGLLGFIYQMFN